MRSAPRVALRFDIALTVHASIGFGRGGDLLFGEKCIEGTLAALFIANTASLLAFKFDLVFFLLYHVLK